jgi:hypothetical protein
MGPSGDRPEHWGVLGSALAPRRSRGRRSAAQVRYPPGLGAMGSARESSRIPRSVARHFAPRDSFVNGTPGGSRLSHPATGLAFVAARLAPDLLSQCGSRMGYERPRRRPWHGVCPRCEFETRAESRLVDRNNVELGRVGSGYRAGQDRDADTAHREPCEYVRVARVETILGSKPSLADASSSEVRRPVPFDSLSMSLK